MLLELCCYPICSHPAHHKPRTLRYKHITCIVYCTLFIQPYAPFHSYSVWGLVLNCVIVLEWRAARTDDNANEKLFDYQTHPIMQWYTNDGGTFAVTTKSLTQHVAVRRRIASGISFAKSQRYFDSVFVRLKL